MGFPGSSSGKESTCNAVHTGSVQCLGKEDPWRRERLHTPVFLGFPGGLDIKESAWNARRHGLGRCLGEGNGYLLQYVGRTLCFSGKTQRVIAEMKAFKWEINIKMGS